MSLDTDLKRQVHRQAVNLGIVRESDPWNLMLNQISLHFAVWHSWDLSRVSRLPLQNLLELLHAEDPASESTNPNQDVHFSSDFSVVVWQGQQHFFNRTQARVVELLYNESRKGTVGLHQDTIGQRLQSCNNRFRLFHVFRNKNGKMHPLWNVLICRVEPGIYALKMENENAGQTPVSRPVSSEPQASVSEGLASPMHIGRTRSESYQNVGAGHGASDSISQNEPVHSGHGIDISNRSHLN